MTIAALLTSHNRKDLTLACLRSLYGIVPGVEVFLTDDGSTDGTAEAIGQEFPKARVIRGSGNLFWSRGMRKAWCEALKGDYDYYLWLNDDQVLYKGFFEELLECMNIQGEDCIVSGLVEDFEHSRVLYGGYDEQKNMVLPNETPQPIYLLNGNIVLVPKSVVERIGILDPYYKHDLADLDYGLTAREHGIPVIATRKVVGMGYPNSPCRVRLWNSSIFKRFKKLNSPLGSPLNRNFHFRRKHFGLPHALAFCSFVVLLNVMPDWLVVLLWGDAYVDHGRTNDYQGIRSRH